MRMKRIPVVFLDKDKEANEDKDMEDEANAGEENKATGRKPC